MHKTTSDGKIGLVNHFPQGQITFKWRTTALESPDASASRRRKRILHIDNCARPAGRTLNYRYRLACKALIESLVQPASNAQHFERVTAESAVGSRLATDKRFIHNPKLACGAYTVISGKKSLPIRGARRHASANKKGRRRFAGSNATRPAFGCLHPS